MQTLINGFEEIFNSRVTTADKATTPQATIYSGSPAEKPDFKMTLSIAKAGTDAILEVIRPGRSDVLLARFAVERAENGPTLHIDTHWNITVIDIDDDFDEVTKLCQPMIKEARDLFEQRRFSWQN